MISVVIIGSGNVGAHFFNTFKQIEQINVLQWFSRTLSNIEHHKNEVAITNSLDNIIDYADIYIIAVADSAISEVSSKLLFSNKLVVHTSGALSIHNIDRKHRRGVLYPLQTFTKDTPIDLKTVPFCIEALDKEDYTLLKKLTQYIGSSAKRMNSEQRNILHLAAVFVNNFTNQLYRIAHEITDEKGVDFHMLKPLLLETAKKVHTISPYMAQTDPAKRGDLNTILTQLKLLKKEQHKALYKLLTQSIQETHGSTEL